MSEPPVLRSEREGVLELVLNRPAKLNALTNEMFGIIREAVDDLRVREDLKVLLIRAKGRYFCAGVDQLQTGDSGGPTPPDSPAAIRAFMRVPMGGGMHALYQEMERVEKPIVVAHHATCVGGGLEMSLSCDFRLAAQSASYSFPEMAFAMLPLSGGVSRLTRLCGPHWARWMLLANEPVPAERAVVDNRVLVANEGPTTIHEQVNGVPVTRVGSLRKVGAVALCPTFPYWMRKLEADVMVVHEPNPVAIVAHALAQPRSRLVFWVHAEVVRPAWRYRAFYRPFIERWEI